MKTVLAIDLGTSRIRAGLFDRSGHCCSLAARDYPILSPEPGAAEQDPLAWRIGFFEAVREVLSLCPEAEVEGLSFSGQMHGTVLLDLARKPLGNAIIWCDQRGGKAAQDLVDRIGSETYARLTGNPLATGFQAATLGFLRENDPDRFRRIGQVLLPQDFLIAEITGRFVSEPTGAVSTGLLDVGLPEGKNVSWSLEILEALSLKPAQFPHLVPSLLPATRENLTLSAEAAHTAGLREGTPILAFGGDAVAGGMLVLGGSQESDAVGLLSSGGQLLVSRDRPCPCPLQGIHLLPQMAPGRWFSMAAFLAAGLSLEWWRGCVEVQAGRKVEIPELLDAAGRVPPGSEGLCFLPHIAGERTPHLDPEARGAFWGISRSHALGHFARAILEGVAFSFRLGVELLEHTGGPIRSFSLGGGGVKSSLWCQIFADALQREVRALSDVTETSLAGAAFMGAQALGWESEPWLPKTGAVIEPEPSRSDAYERNYRQFVRLAPLLKSIRD